MKPRWRRLALASGDLNGRIKKDALDASGAYAIRERSSGRVVYVGESHCGALWKTILRHFHAPESFARVRETGVFRRGPAPYDVAIWVMSRGKRKDCRSGRTGDDAAIAAQAEWIRTLDPVRNKEEDYPADWDLDDEAFEDDDAWGGLLGNPGGRTELGRLTELRWREGRRERVRRWGVRSAPSLVYDARGRLFVVYRGAELAPATVMQRREYERTHWGARGRGMVLAGELARGPFVVLGQSTSITYTTRKGSTWADWVHAWGEGATGAWKAPSVVEHRCKVRGCEAEGLLALRSGTYRVTADGIVG